MSLRNRLGNASNPYQGDSKKVLCVCSAGLLRSPTIAWVLSNPPYNFNTRSAGISTEFALIPVDEVLLTWADEVVCAEERHAEYIQSEWPWDFKLHVLNLPDEFEFRSPELIKLIEATVKPIFKKEN
jgi:predicted protein tyrosine phosphatase